MLAPMPMLGGAGPVYDPAGLGILPLGPAGRGMGGILPVGPVGRALGPVGRGAMPGVPFSSVNPVLRNSLFRSMLSPAMVENDLDIYRGARPSEAADIVKAAIRNY